MNENLDWGQVGLGPNEAARSGWRIADYRSSHIPVGPTRRLYFSLGANRRELAREPRVRQHSGRSVVCRWFDSGGESPAALRAARNLEEGGVGGTGWTATAARPDGRAGNDTAVRGRGGLCCAVRSRLLLPDPAPLGYNSEDADKQVVESVSADLGGGER